MRVSFPCRTLLLLVVARRRAAADSLTVDVSTFAELKDAVAQASNDGTRTSVRIAADLLWEEEVVVAGGQSVELVGGAGSAVLLNATAAQTRHLRIDVGGTLSMYDLFFVGGSLASGDFGAVMHNGGVVETMRGCSFSHNEARAGGVVYNYGTIQQVEDCSFEDNSAEIRGGAVYNHGVITAITGCTFARNSARWGGAIRNNDVIGVIDSCEFRDNRASYGGAFLQGSSSQPVFFVGTVFAGNDPSDILVEGNGVVRLYDTELSPSLPDPIEGRASGCPSNDNEAALGMVFDLDAWELEGEFRCRLCPMGKYMNREVHASTSNMLTSCLPCPEGTVNDQQGQESCAVCLASLHQTASADNLTCECAETWTTDPDTELCTCPAGHYQEGMSCVPCEPGTSKESLGEDKGLCIAEDTTLVEGLAAGGAVLGAALLVCLGFLGFRKVRTYFKLQREKRKRMRATVLKALATARQLEYPVTVMRATDFCTAGRLLPHERLRDQGQLTLFDSLEEARFVRCGRPIVFFSHQWTAFDTPDHTNKQYELMKRSLEQLCEVKEWIMEDVFVWVDFCSIPQTLSTLQSLAIHSLAAYASVAEAFVVIAPQVQHGDLCTVCDEASYRSRMWCRAEQFAHVVRNGSENMWLAADDAGAVLMEAGWVASSALDVFGGELTCCRKMHEGMERCDRESLLIPILGLYGEMYASRYTVDGQCPSAKLLLDRIEAEGHGAFFPKEFEFVKKDSTHTSENRELFGDLVQEMHQLIDRDEDVRRRIFATRCHFRTKVLHGPLRSSLTAEEVSPAAACKEGEVPRLTERKGGRSKGSGSVPVFARDLDTIIVHNFLQQNERQHESNLMLSRVQGISACSPPVCDHGLRLKALR